MFATLIVAVVAVFAGYNIYQSQSTVTLSEVALANVEALAQSEASGTCYEVCRPYYGWQCTRINGGVTTVCVQYRKNN